MTIIDLAKKNKITPLFRHIAQKEKISVRLLLKLIKEAKIVIPFNSTHYIKNPCAIGKGLTTKINVNIGTSPDEKNIEDEIKKLEIALKYGADTIMDLSIGGDLNKIRKLIIKKSLVPVGTVPIYEVAINALRNRGDFVKFSIDDILEVLEAQAKDGVDFFTIHAGVTKRNLELVRKCRRMLNIVSRGGAILANWISYYKKENPLYEYFDRILEIAYKYDITLSLGDGLRPGSIFDATDKAQIGELKTLAELVLRCIRKNVQVMIEGPGHVPLNQIRKNVLLQKKLCHGVPFYVLGPLVTDIASGYDHISAAIGGAIAGSLGADFLCYVTPSEHLRHPSIEDVKEGTIAMKIAAHSADIAKGIKSAFEWDKKMSLARRKRDWEKQIEFSIDPIKARLLRETSKPYILDVCTMCGDFCSIKLIDKCLKKKYLRA